MNLFQLKSYLQYIIKARHRKGYGLHSPFVFNLVREVFYCRYPYYAFEEIDRYRNKLNHSKDVYEMTDYGAGSVRFSGKARRVGWVAQRSAIDKKYGELLFRLLQHLKPPQVVELGTSLGISTAYFALADKRRSVETIEGCPQTANLAKKTFADLNCVNVNQYVGQFKDVLPDLVGRTEQLGFVFFDGHHQKQATIDYFNNCLLKAGNETVFVFDDIHWSRGMEEAWGIIRRHPQVTVSIDLFQLGIVFFRKECQKQHFVVRY